MKQRNNLMKDEPHDEWCTMFKKLEAMASEVLRTTWDDLKDYDPTQYYAPGITMDSWAQAVYSELDHRAIPVSIHIPERIV